MTDDNRERRRVEAILTGDTEPSPADLEELRTMADTVKALLGAPEPDHVAISSTLKNMMRIYRPMTGEDIQRYADGRKDA